MDDRYFNRMVVDIPSVIVVELEDGSFQEFTGTIHDISETGIQVRMDENDAEIATKLTSGIEFKFQAVDEYELINEQRMDIVQGNAEVVWINQKDGVVSLGCKMHHILADYTEYVSNRKLALFIQGNK